MIKNINFSNIDPQSIVSHMGQLNPLAALEDLGISPESARKALNGDFSQLSVDIKPETLDFNVLFESYGQYFNRNLIQYFYIKAKKSEQFTEDEIKNYKNVYNKWFDIVFKAGNLNIEIAPEFPESEILHIKVDDDYFSMIKNFEGQNLIIFET